MADIIFNKNELVLDRVRQLAAHDLETSELLFRLTSLEDPSLGCTAEGEEVVDAIGALITTLYRAKKATFSASNSLMSFDLAAAQYGTKKEVAGRGKEGDPATITDYAYEILDVQKAENGDTYQVKLAHAPNVDSIKYIYTLDPQNSNEIATGYKAGSAVSDVEFTVADDGTITLPTAVTSGKVYVEYTYENKDAIRVVNKASEFPTAVSVVIYAIFRDTCNENKVYSGKIICPKAKLNPESIELALTATGKHPFEMTMMKDYCSEDSELFSIIVSQ